MKLVPIFFATLFSGFSLFSAASAQTPAPEPLKSDAPPLEALAKKIDEQNAKIDALSQQILKLEQQISHIRPGVMIGENTPSKMYKVGIDELQKSNNIEDGRKLQAGQTIVIPTPPPVPSASPAPSN
ncbi:MAG: hypothetical protein DMF29_11650 [Verrucomicrobia bacterium]|nr:MAG: hypothetical protein DMF29_11650 [Verrucomicrobiota bacterium]